MFGMVKAQFKKDYVEHSKEPLINFINRTMVSFTDRDFSAIFRKCGYTASGFNSDVEFKGKNMLRELDFNVEEDDEDDEDL